MSFHILSYVQGKRPICGIYAILNGLFDYKYCRRKEIYAIANVLWESAICDNIPLNKSATCNTVDLSQLKYSIIGEFSSSKLLCDFINDKVNSINQSLPVSAKKLDEAKPIKNFDCSNLTFQDFNNCFYIIPINSNGRGKNKNIFHWLCLKLEGKNIRIANRVTRSERRAKCSLRKINSLTELQSTFKNMRFLRNKCFFISEWAKQEKVKKDFPDNVKENFDELNKNNIKIKYDNLCKDNEDYPFNAIKVSYKGN